MKSTISQLMTEALKEAKEDGDLIPSEKAVNMMMDYACLVERYHSGTRVVSVDGNGGIECVFKKPWGRIVLFIKQNGDNPVVVVVRDGKTEQFTYPEWNPDC